MLGILYILLFFVLLIFIITLVPLRYSCELVTVHPIKLSIRVQWLGKMFRFRLDYEEQKSLYKEFYLFFKSKSGAEQEYEDWLAGRVKEAVEKGDIGESIGDKDIEEENRQTGLPEEDRFIDKFKIYVDYFARWAVIKACLQFLRNIYHHSRPRKIELEGHLGCGDPYYTGLLAAFLFTIWPKAVQKISFDYINVSYVGRWFMSGYIVPAVLLWYLICFLWNKPIREIILWQLRGGNVNGR